MTLSRRDFHKALLASAAAGFAGALPAFAAGTSGYDRVMLNRLTFGATPASQEQIGQLGLQAWLDDQLQKPLQDDALTARLANARLKIEYEAGQTAEGATWQALSEERPLQHLETDPKDLLKFLDFGQGFAWPERIRPAKEVIAAAFIRAAHSDAQLRELMTQFWHEHFSVNALKDEYTAIFFPQYDAMMRAHALGNFRTLLGDVARAPAMLNYLNNDTSRASPANENYARELLELHTLGAENYFNDLYDDWRAVPGAKDGAASGYIDQDVYEVARAFTGWSIGHGQWIDDGTYAPQTGRFEYIENWHDPYQKRILGHEFGPNRAPMADGEDVLDMLAAHPGTARFVTRKLLRTLGIETPSREYHARVAQVFHMQKDAGDQIAQTLRAIVLDDEFAQTPPSKLRRPFEFVIAYYRASGAQMNPTRLSIDWHLERMGWTQHSVRPPTGHSDHSADWANTRTLNGLVDLALYAHADWFNAIEWDAARAHGDAAQTWGDLARLWEARFALPQGALDEGLVYADGQPGDALTKNPDHLAWANRTLLSLAALSAPFMFR
jgi:uncharacterized protein (DUF1800 family)